MRLPAQPVIYEVNTWVWLADLEARLGRPLTLAEVPEEVWDDLLAASHADAVWLMGVWTRSPVSAAVAAADADMVAGFRRALVDFRPADNVGSAYAVRAYEVDPRLGGRRGLAVARRALAERGVALLLDFVPNHVAPDHRWAFEHPEFFVEGSEGDLTADPPTHLRVAGRILASGRDPNFPAWTDTLQLNLHSPALRSAIRATLLDIAEQCDGVRCDMAMLVLDHVIERTWGERAGHPRERPYWEELIPEVRAVHPGFLFLAESYWDLEPALIGQGFDLCYDKVVLDLLVQGDAAGLEAHLQAPVEVQRHFVRFVENHDEPRAARALPGAVGRAAAVVVTTLPGAVLLHEGQLEGRKRSVPAFLGRRPAEEPDADAVAFHAALLTTVRDTGMREGTWHLLSRQGPVLAWRWDTAQHSVVVAVNVSDVAAEVGVPAGARELLASPGLVATAALEDDPHAEGTDAQLGPWGFAVWRVTAGR